LPKNGDYILDVYYEPQKWVEVGTMISGVTLIAVMFILAFILLKERFRK